MPAVVRLASRVATAAEVWLELDNQRSETSSSVGPMPPLVRGDSEAGNSPAIKLGGLVPLVPLWPGIGKYLFGSIGDCPCLALIMIRVEPSSPSALSAAAISAME